MYFDDASPGSWLALLSPKICLYLTRISDTVLYGVSVLILCILVLSWYLFLYRPVTQKVSSLAQQNLLLTKRTESLKKRTDRLLTIEKDYDATCTSLQQIAEKFPASMQDSMKSALDKIKKSGLYLESWKPEVQEAHQFFSTCLVASRLRGTFESFSVFLSNLEPSVIITSCTIIKSVQELNISIVFQLCSKESI